MVMRRFDIDPHSHAISFFLPFLILAAIVDVCDLRPFLNVHIPSATWSSLLQAQCGHERQTMEKASFISQAWEAKTCEKVQTPCHTIVRHTQREWLHVDVYHTASSPFEERVAEKRPA